LLILLNNIEFVHLIPIPLGPNVPGVAHTPNTTVSLLMTTRDDTKDAY
jgi:hypothetical protein